MSLITKVSSLAKEVSLNTLLPNFAKVKADIKEDGSWLTIADTQAHQQLMEALPKLINVPVLSEELTVQEQQSILDQPSLNYWCIDPLDGTSNFTQGIPYWCMSIALIDEGKVVLAVIYDPNRDECFATTAFSNTTLNGNMLNLVEHKNCELKDSMGLIDFKRLNKKKALAMISHPPYRSQRSFGSSALDLCWIAANRCQVYCHGKQNLWDHAAGLLILKNANGCSQTFEGDNVFQHDLKPKSILAASNPRLMKRWLEYFNSI